MKKVKILTDSCADLSKELREKYDIAYAAMNFVKDGVEHTASLNWDEISSHDFFDIMRNGERMTTTQVPAASFIEIFTGYIESGYDVVYIACSNPLSGSINTANVVANDLMQKYPDAKIFCIDSLTSGMGEGLLTIEATKMRDNGKTAEEIAAEISTMRPYVNAFMTVASLETFKAAGRISAAENYNRIMFGAKPILICDANGRIVPIKKVMGRTASLDEIVALTAASMTDPKNSIAYIAHGDCLEDAEYIASKLRETVSPADIYINTFGPITGISTGPDSMGVFVLGKEVTYAV